MAVSARASGSDRGVTAELGEEGGGWEVQDDLSAELEAHAQPHAGPMLLGGPGEGVMEHQIRSLQQQLEAVQVSGERDRGRLHASTAHVRKNQGLQTLTAEASCCLHLHTVFFQNIFIYFPFP